MTEFSPKAIEQLNQTVREVSRRVRNEAPPRARWQKRKAPATTGGSGGGGLATNNCCGTIYQAGSVDLDGLEWATDYTITLAAPIGTVTVTDQGSGTWESDAIDVTCTVDEVTVTDEYTVTMTATGNAPGEVIVTVALTSGGGYGGAAGCCETTESGFAWKYVNCCIVDPLAGWSMTRDPSGFSGKECEIGGCEICVTPTGIVQCEGVDWPSKFQVSIQNIQPNTSYLSGTTFETVSCDGSCEESIQSLCEHVTGCSWESSVQAFTPTCTDPKQYTIKARAAAIYSSSIFSYFRVIVDYYNDDWVNTWNLEYRIDAANWLSDSVNTLDYVGLSGDRIDNQLQCHLPETITVVRAV